MKEALREIMSGIAAAIIVFMLFAIPIAAYSYTQRFVKVNENEAIQGLFFTATIDLREHKKIGNGSGLFGVYETYTRSDRQKETIKVYKGN